MVPPRRRLSRPLFCVLCCLFLWGINVAVHFPYSIDAVGVADHEKAAAEFYRTAYAPSRAPTEEERQQEEIYVKVAERAARFYNIEGEVRKFVADYGLENKRVLDIGAGRGYLQDIVPDYVGLDISPTAARYFHKPFVLGTATGMPFHDNEFDAAWSIWVLEHIPVPESALREMRRVVKPGGLILLRPAWFCSSWGADGYAVRPYRDFGITGKLKKASLPLRQSALFQISYIMPIRALRLLGAELIGGPTTFHYTRLIPNYHHYWVPDSDAVNSMDPYEAILWFESRGDHCLNCQGGIHDFTTGPEAPLIIRVGSKL
jgi:SAM-dependent methyltransferase